LKQTEKEEKHRKMADIGARIPVIIFQEGNKFVAYCPALDLSSCGDTEVQARRRFTEAVQVFFRELIAMGTLEEVLEESGWRKDPHKQVWSPPVYKSTIEDVKIYAGA